MIQNHLRNSPPIIEVADELAICQEVKDFCFILIFNYQIDEKQLLNIYLQLTFILFLC